MTEHLPECHLWLEPMLSEQDWCICDRLRACEQRVLDAIDLPAANVQYQKVGYADGLDAAREAIAALEPMLDVNKHNGGYDCCGCSTPAMLLDDAVTAIDSLREKT
jgi:hypothetical protein